MRWVKTRSSEGGIIGPPAARDKIALISLAVSAALYAYAAWHLTGGAQIQQWLAAYAATWLAYLVLCTRPRIPVASMLVAALLFRLMLCWSTPWLSDDLHRYLLDGKALAAGINPYRHAPAAEEMRQLAPEIVQRVNHPELPTIYPPLVPIVSAAVSALGGGVVAWRVLMSLLDFGVALAIRRLFGSWRAAAVYALCPLAIFESGANGHLEAMLLLFWVLAVGATQRSGLARACLPWTLALLTKYLPGGFLPLWMRRRDFFGGTAIILLLTAFALYAFARHGVDPFASLRVYLADWRFNAPFFTALERLGLSELLLRALPFAVLLLGVMRSGLSGGDPLTALPRLLFLFLCMGPTVHPWYALWVLPWLGPRPHWGLWAFVGAMGLSYVVWWEVERGRGWTLQPWQSGLIWGLVAAAWIAQWLRGRADQESRRASSTLAATRSTFRSSSEG